MSRRQARLPRIEQSKSAHIEDETSHLWAVSYADFLMVLLSFFIIFFSFNKEDKKTAIDDIVAYSTKIMGADSPSTKRAPSSFESSPNTIKNLEGKFNGFSLETQEDLRALNIRFPDDIYKKGRADLDGDARAQFEAMITILSKFNGKVKITFIGHTDQTVLVNQQYPGINDNFDLSALRASQALRLAIKSGLNPQKLFLAGSAENKRNSRTLSVYIEEDNIK